ncbi:hypothetical protein GALL_165110 [mine drainage metagenome]|uniref:DUF2147 domain-containing protein n=1 Tax=mine drainage metagenome TaxID=410659 RepID=A0A1J5SB50_9ZZZZ
MAFNYKAAIACMLLSAIPSLAWCGELEGLWQEFDDQTGNLEALIRIRQLSDNTYEGNIEKIIPDKPENAAMRCSACTGSLYNQPLLGMRILSGMTRKDKLTFEGGTVIDPDEGKTYRCRIRLSEDGKTIEVTGYVGFVWMGQSEIWKRAN